jgi:hypothetical protein
MDLKKAKMILIIFFLTINVSLLFINLLSGNANKVSKNILNNVYELFEKDGIKISCTIPNNIKPLPQLEMGKTVSSGILTENIFSSEKIGFDVSDYFMIYEIGDHVMYAEKYSGYIILENRVDVSKNGMEYTKRDIIGFDKEVKNIIPAYVILLQNYLNSDIGGIEKIELVYLQYANEDIVGPVWLIMADGRIRYFYAFDAFNGIEMVQKQ